MTTLIPLSNLPKPTILDNDFDGTLVRLKGNYKNATGHYPQQSDPETFLLEQTAYERELLINDMNATAQQNLLAFATGDMLDQRGAENSCNRLPAGFASVTLALSIKPNNPAFVLDTGFTVRAMDGESLFSTMSTVGINTNSGTVEITVQAQVAGTKANGFLAGEIKDIITTHPLIMSAVNIETSQGGSEIENDDRYRQRIYLAPSSFSVAGPYEAYEYWAMTANGAVANAKVWSPLPNDIEIFAVLAGGEPASDAIKNEILTALSDRKRRPLGDRVAVKDPTAIEVDCTFTLEVFSDYKAMANTVLIQFEAALNATINAWKEQLGRDIVPQALIGLGQKIEGVYRCSTDLNYQSLAMHEHPLLHINAINLIITPETSMGGS